MESVTASIWSDSLEGPKYQGVGLQLRNSLKYRVKSNNEVLQEPVVAGCFCHCFVIVPHYLDNRGDNWALSLSHVKTSGGAACFVIRSLLVLEVESSLIAFLQENPQWVWTLSLSPSPQEFNLDQQILQSWN